MDKRLVLFRVRPGKLDAWREWTQELETSLRSEALETLREEHAVAEFSALIEIDGDNYVIGYMEGENMTSANMDREMNRKHKAIKDECLERLTEGEFLYHFRAMR